VKGRRGLGRRENARDRERDRHRPTHARGCYPTMEGASGRTARLLFTERRRKRPWQPGRWPHAKAQSRRNGSDRGVRGTATTGAPEESCRAPTRRRLPKRIQRRETLGPPVSWHRCKPVVQGRGVSLEEMPVAHEARVLVVRQWEAEVGRTHRARSPRRVARQTVGRAS